LTLFEPTSIGLQPTRRAAEITRIVKLAISAFRQGIEDLRGWQGFHSGRLAIGCLPLTQVSILPEALNQFALEFPDVIVQVVDAYYASLARGLRRGDLALIVGALRQGDLPDGLVQSRLFSDRLVIAAPPDHPLAQLRNVKDSAL
jgi:LysR family transcriptional regulator of gallate degradation